MVADLNEIASHLESQDSQVLTCRRLVLEGNTTSLLSTLDLRQSMRGDALETLFRALASLLYEGRSDAIAALWAAIPQNNLTAVVTMFLHGCGLCATGQAEEGWNLIRTASGFAHRYGDMFRESHILRLLLTMGPNSTLPSEWLAALAAQPPAKPDATGDAPVLAVCADPVYLNKYAASLASSVRETAPDMPMHFHILAPADQAEAAWSALEPQLQGCTWSHSKPAAANPTAYACGRLSMAQTLLERYRRPVVLTDIDARLGPAFHQALEAAAGSDFAAFSTEERFPWLDWAAGFLYFGHTAAGLTIAGAFREMVTDKLAGRYFWFLDQALLHAAISALKQRPDIRFVDLTRATGTQLRGDCLNTSLFEEDVDWKWTLRVAD